MLQKGSVLGGQYELVDRLGEGRRFRDDGGASARVRRCATCGVTDEDPSVDIRVCSCAKCGKPTEYCLPHARSH